MNADIQLHETVKGKFKTDLNAWDRTSSVGDPDPGSRVFLPLDPGLGMEKKSGSGMNILDYFSES
jgi:hypothetical protein